MPYLSCKKIENDVYNFPTWQYCKYKDIFDSRIIINSTAKFYISISYQKDLLSIDTRIFTPSIYILKVSSSTLLTFGNEEISLNILFNNPCNDPHCNIPIFVNMCHNKGHLIFLSNGAAVVATVSNGVDTQF